MALSSHKNTKGRIKTTIEITCRGNLAKCLKLKNGPMCTACGNWFGFQGEVLRLEMWLDLLHISSAAKGSPWPYIADSVSKTSTNKPCIASSITPYEPYIAPILPLWCYHIGAPI